MKKSRLLFVIFLNIAIVVFEITFGVIGNSMGLIADALHNLSDVIAIIIAYIALSYSEKKPTKDMTYGYMRSEMMAGFINSLFLIIVMVYVLIESVKKIIQPEEIEGLYMMIVAGIAVVANVFSVILLQRMNVPGHGHSHEHPDDHDHEHEHGKKKVKNEENINIRAAILHLASDVGISVAVVIGGLLIFLFNIYFIDAIISILFALFILFKAAQILRDSFFSLMDKSRGDIDEIAKLILEFKEVKSIHGIHLTKPTSNDVHLSAHLVLNGEPGLNKIEILMEKVRLKLAEHGVTHIILQPESEKYQQDDLLCSPH